jgi:hypothetical protein
VIAIGRFRVNKLRLAGSGITICFENDPATSHGIFINMLDPTERYAEKAQNTHSLLSS